MRTPFTVIALAAGLAGATAALTAAPAAAEVAVIQRDLLALRAGPTASSALVDRLKKGERLDVLDREGDWLRVTSGITTGWVPSGLVRVESGTKAPTPVRVPQGEGYRLVPAPSPPPRDPLGARVPLDMLMRSPESYRWERGHVVGRVASMDALDGEAQLIDEAGSRVFLTLERLSEDARVAAAVAMARGTAVTVLFDGIVPPARLVADGVVVNGEIRR